MQYTKLIKKSKKMIEESNEAFDIKVPNTKERVLQVDEFHLETEKRGDFKKMQT